jgi:hypothetical protein
MSVVVVISQHLLNVFVQLANKRGFKKKNRNSNSDPSVVQSVASRYTDHTTADHHILMYIVKLNLQFILFLCTTT